MEQESTDIDLDSILDAGNLENPDDLERTAQACWCRPGGYFALQLSPSHWVWDATGVRVRFRGSMERQNALAAAGAWNERRASPAPLR